MGTLISFQKKNNVDAVAAGLIAEGKIIGWVQGRSEFGPRALGNRSILADPRPSENKDIVNKMVKKRENYRPFAPSVIQEAAEIYFDVDPGTCSYDYMTFVVNVKDEYRKVLGAVTHVDGTARLQTVSKKHNPRYWNLIREFGKISGIPMLLNTSFNNNVEPIVNSAEEAIVCFLTTGLDYLIIKDYVISKKHDNIPAELLEMIPSLLPHTVLHARRSFDTFDTSSVKCAVGFNYSEKYNYQISPDMYKLLSKVDGRKTFGELLVGSFATEDADAPIAHFFKEATDLWNLRYIHLSPRKAGILLERS
jgi:carbamoyltransferase